MFFHTQLLISALLAVSSVLGAPSAKRDDADPCNGLGTGAYSNLTNFRVAALHSGRNKNDYGSQVILATTGVISGASSRTFREAYWSTNPGVEDLTMVNGGITAAPPGWDVATQVLDNDVPFFFVSADTPRPPAANIWCGVPSNEVSGTHPYDFLAAHGRFDLWSSCYKKFSETEGVYRIAYNVDTTKTSPVFDVETCVPVHLSIVKDGF